ncbi:peroxisomal membrane protein PEX16 [Eurytemora carolleeae]|uniref:peroxisomal membrane protein PEX16 n=1 Tax=Eurytemora carolleeae TaxID=1294199 RepID=UPI000C789460|nr:peroxisomal membrane protein PEX16 [Eurytemora carolleeae]|eukprot:XP_023338496.1 peroxisomal membrane protein PEX16-like [Eurytemora affinis]
MRELVGPGLEYIEKYRCWALSNPNLVKDIETFLRGLSYILTGYIKESVLLSEFVFSAAQLVSLINNRIIHKDVVITAEGFSQVEEVLRVLHCVEVFLEIAALRLGGPAARWALIFSLQVVKTALRLVLLYRRRKMLVSLNPEYVPSVQVDQKENYFVLKSGRIIRSIGKGREMALPLLYQQLIYIYLAPGRYRRSWRPPCPTKPTLTKHQLAAELIHVAQPVTHLLAFGLFGSKSWTPFLLSLSMDCASQGIYRESDLNAEQEKELLRRAFNLFSYILRSPFYDQQSKRILLVFLSTLEKHLPIGGSLVSSIISYIPTYQQ